MARLVRRYRRGYSRYYRRNLSRWPYRSWRRGLRSAQVAGNRRFNVVIPVQDAFSMEVDSSSFYSNVHGMCPYYYSGNDQGVVWKYTHGSMVMSDLYRVYCKLYDEVKINSVSVVFQLMNGIGIGGVVPALKFVTSWDRDCSGHEIISQFGIPTTAQMTTGSESQSVLVSNTSTQKVYRFNRATDLMEKCTFHDCSLSTSGTSVFDTLFSAGDGKNRIGYCPACFFMINTAIKPEQGQKFTFNISMEVKYNVTFRNPKYGLSAGAGKSVSGEKSVLQDVLPDVVEDEKSGSRKFDELSDEQKAKIMELIGSMEDEKGA